MFKLKPHIKVNPIKDSRLGGFVFRAVVLRHHIACNTVECTIV